MLDAAAAGGTGGDQPSRRALIACAAAGGAAGLLWLRLRASQRAPPGVAATDFEAFLVAPPPPSRPQPQQQRGRAASAVAATDFAAFLKVAPTPPQPAATDFASFLIDASQAGDGQVGGGAEAAAAAEAAPAEPVPEGAVPVAVLYGTEYGFAREIAEKVADMLKASGGEFWPLLHDVSAHPSGYPALSKLQAALLVFSTQGDGVPPSEARGFCDWLASPAATEQAAVGPHLAYSVCALGDTSYTHFCRCGRTLDAALAAGGAKALAPRVDVDKEDWAAVDAWLAAALEGLRGARSGMATFADLGGVAASGLVAGAAADAEVGAAGYSKARPLYARVVAVEGLCTLSGPDDKDTVRLELALEEEEGEEGAAAGSPPPGLDYAPGDALGIWPTNPPGAVDDLLAALGATGDEAVPTPAWHYRQQPPAGPTISLRHALSAVYDIRAPKGRPLLQALRARLAEAAAAGKQGNQLGAAAPSSPLRASIDLQVDATAAAAAGEGAAAGADDDTATTKPQQHASVAAAAAAVDALLAGPPAALDAYLAPRHVADVLAELGGRGAGSALAGVAPLDPPALLGVLRPLAPRLYSISSAPREYAPPACRVAATIAVVRYSSLGKTRRGVASSQAGERLAPGDRLPVFVTPNPDFRLPADPSTPVVMVGPGTGLAPFRSFIAARLQEAAAGGAAPGPMHLFFGCRRRDQDFLYGQQLTAWAEEGAITLHTAFSREGPAKVYVQQRLREAADDVWALLQAGGHFYVCGDAGSMAGAVEAALLDIIAARLAAAGGDQQEGAATGGAAERAAAYLEQLASSGRYQRDVWFS